MLFTVHNITIIRKYRTGIVFTVSIKRQLERNYKPAGLEKSFFLIIVKTCPLKLYSEGHV